MAQCVTRTGVPGGNPSCCEATVPFASKIPASGNDHVQIREQNDSHYHNEEECSPLSPKSSTGVQLGGELTTVTQHTIPTHVLAH